VYEAKHNEALAQLGIDLSQLHSFPRGGHGKEWPVPWRVACEVLFVNGLTPGEIQRQLDGPDRRTIYEWSEAGGWLAKRDAHIRDVAKKALAQSAESQVAIVERHLKALRTIQNAAMISVVKKKVEGKTLEGVMQAVVSAIRMERTVLGLNDGPEVVVADNRVQAFVMQLDSVPPEQREAYFAAMRQKFEIEERLNQLSPPPPSLPPEGIVPDKPKTGGGEEKEE
jgi:hypothetical protein